MDEKMLSDLKDVRINMTSEMKDFIVKLLVIKQTLEDEELLFRDKRVLKSWFFSNIVPYFTE